MKKIILGLLLSSAALVSSANTIYFQNNTGCEYTVNIDGYGLYTVNPNGTPTTPVTSTFNMTVLKIGWSGSWSASMGVGDGALGYPPNANSNAQGLPAPPCLNNPAAGYTVTFTPIGGGNYYVIIN